MRLSQATLKVCRTELWGYTSGAWEKLPFACSYPPDGRFIGRNVGFYDRRTLITPADIPSEYSILRIGSDDSEEVILYASQQNVNNDETYLFSHTVFNVMAYATVRRLVKSLSASGMPGKATNSTVGLFPIIFEKGFSGPENREAAGVYVTRVVCYIHPSSGLKKSDTLEIAGETYTVDELIPELKLLFAQLTKL